MTKEHFNPSDWLGYSQPQQDSSNPNTVSTNIVNPNFNPLPEHEVYIPSQSVEVSNHDTQLQDIEEIVSRIESSSIDIAPNYSDWRDLGFAIAEALGENGRSYYQRISRFYPNYSASETDKQYNACLKSNGQGITIKTLFHLAKQAGVSISIPNTVISTQNSQPNKSPNSPNSPAEETEEIEETPTFSQDITSLPSLLSQIVSNADSDKDADLLLLGAITVFSACLPNLYGIYAKRKVFPNLFLFVTAPASAGKGRLTLCRLLVQPIHENLKQLYAAELEEYKRKQAEYSRDKSSNDPPQEPPIKTLLIPANSSATSVYQVLNDNNGEGLIFETEGDTLANTFKSDYGNFSDGFRKAFHHEPISYNRRKEREFVELSKPRLSALLSGTPHQILSLIPDVENGLFSRFIFYYLNMGEEWLDVFANDNQPLDDHFQQIGEQFYNLYNILKTYHPIRFVLSKSQQNDFNAFFAQVQKDYSNIFGLEIVASVRRLGLITFRIAMILSALRIIDGKKYTDTLQCDDEDFLTAITMVRILIRHTAKVYSSLFQKTASSDKKDTEIKKKYLSELPDEFDRKTYLAVAQKLGIPSKTAEKYISRFCFDNKLKHLSFGKYAKP